MTDPDWKRHPATIEELLDSIARQGMWEMRNQERAPSGIFLTAQVVAEIGARILVLEQKADALEEAIVIIARHLNSDADE